VVVKSGPEMREQHEDYKNALMNAFQKLRGEFNQSRTKVNDAYEKYDRSK